MYLCVRVFVWVYMYRQTYGCGWVGGCVRPFVRTCVYAMTNDMRRSMHGSMTNDVLAFQSVPIFVAEFEPSVDMKTVTVRWNIHFV